MTTPPNATRIAIDYDLHRNEAARLRGEAIGAFASRALVALKPAPRPARILGFALILGGLAFWPGLPSHRPAPAAADPIPVDRPAPASWIPVDLPVGISDAI